MSLAFSVATSSPAHDLKLWNLRTNKECFLFPSGIIISKYNGSKYLDSSPYSPRHDESLNCLKWAISSLNESPGPSKFYSAETNILPKSLINDSTCFYRSNTAKQKYWSLVIVGRIQCSNVIKTNIDYNYQNCGTTSQEMILIGTIWMLSTQTMYQAVCQIEIVAPCNHCHNTTRSQLMWMEVACHYPKCISTSFVVAYSVIIVWTYIYHGEELLSRRHRTQGYRKHCNLQMYTNIKHW